MHIGKYIDLVHRTELDLVNAFKQVAKAHGAEVDVYQTCTMLSLWSQQMADELDEFTKVYAEEKDNEPDRLTQTLLKKTRKGAMALLRDLHDLYLIVSEVQICCTILKQAAAGLRDNALLNACQDVESQSKRQLSWLMTRVKSAGPQTLIAVD